ncbi:MAG: glycosyltransferase family 4 protein, partial [Thermoplasmata archaeon]|nr:glycosyltransferase family 4 protein [Thermoplasmata archaeon]
VGGSGPEEGRVRERIRSDPGLAARVRFVGPVAEVEKAALLGQTDLFVLPSTSDTASVALLEAMACGTACLASDVGGPKEILEDGGNGRLVSVETPHALAGAIDALLQDPTERRRLGGRGTEFVRASASIDATARRFISLYELLRSERLRQ